jgi:hypothetical protein
MKKVNGPRGPCACVCFHRLSARWLANAGGSFCRRKIGLDTLKRAEILHKRRLSARETDRHSLSSELRNSVRIIIIRVHAATLAQWRADFCRRSFHCGIAFTLYLHANSTALFSSVEFFALSLQCAFSCKSQRSKAYSLVITTCHPQHFVLWCF